MTQNFKLVVEYDGTPFFGWQRQKDRLTVQGALEKTISTILNQDIAISGSGRTDAGVHARGQVASFKAQTRVTPEELKKGINSLIRYPVVIRDCAVAGNEFHAQYSALSKEYHYVILNRQDPCAIGRDYLWHVRAPLNRDLMNQCCCFLEGTHDFKSFENTGSPRTSTKRQIFFARVDREDKDTIVFKVCASGFLKNMVRNIVGTLVDAGHEKISPEAFKRILEAKDRRLAGATAPAGGLFLEKVNYPEEIQMGTFTQVAGKGMEKP